MTLSGGILTVNFTMGGGVVVLADDSAANVVRSDLTAGMGVVHVIDSVLLPFMD